MPESERDETLKKMSPRYNNIYKKNLKNIFEFNHETLDGLANASEFVPENGEDDLKNPKYFYDDWAKLVKDVEVNRVINYGTPIVFTGKLGNVEYKSKTTTYGRLRISKIIDADLDLIQVGGEPILKPYQRLSGKSAAKLMTYLYGFEDWVEKANELQKFALKVVTRRGVVTFDTKTLYADINTKTYKEIEKICDNKDLTDKQKLLLLTESYGKYQKEIEAEFSDDLKNELDRAGRVKIASILSMASPSLIVSGPEEKPIITRGETLLSGFSETNYISHAIENRSLLSLKNSGVNYNCGKMVLQYKIINYCWKDKI